MRGPFWPVFAVCPAALAGMGMQDVAIAADGPGGPVPVDHTLRLAEFKFDPLVQEPTLPDG